MEKSELIGKRVDVLDAGFVELVDFMGSDKRITDAARVSYKDAKSRSEDAFLIDYLMRNEHTSPFEQVVFTFRLRMPVFVARQWVRHRTARINEVSGRYSVLETDFYMPADEDLNFQSADNRQGRGEPLPPEKAAEVKTVMAKCYEVLSESYGKLVDSGLSKEVARMILPLSVYTEFYWQMDLRNLFHFLKLRLDSHAQLEIRRYAQAIFGFVREICPLAIASFINHGLKSVKLSAKEIEMLKSNSDLSWLEDPGDGATKERRRDLRILREKMERRPDDQQLCPDAAVQAVGGGAPGIRQES